MEQSGFFDIEERLARLSGLGDQFEAFSRAVDFEAFRPDLDKTLAYSDGSKGGRPPFDPVLMFKILVIQTLNNLSDEQSCSYRTRNTYVYSSARLWSWLSISFALG